MDFNDVLKWKYARYQMPRFSCDNVPQISPQELVNELEPTKIIQQFRQEQLPLSVIKPHPILQERKGIPVLTPILFSTILLGMVFAGMIIGRFFG